MSYDLKRYPLDVTGASPDNLIENEPHELSDNEIRAVCAKYGAFFTPTMRIYDVANARYLTKGVDWQVSDMLQDATVKFGQEVSMMVLILNKNVGKNITLTYQVVGGEFINMDQSIANLYETILKDTRAVDWAKIVNKPFEYTPTMHRHMLEDVYGFEYIVAALERIRNAIIMSDVPALEYIMDKLDEAVKTLNQRITDEIKRIEDMLALEKQILVKGPKVIWNNSVTDFQITNFDSWMTYQVTSDNVVVSRTDDIIHVTTDNRTGSGSFTVTATATNGFVAHTGNFDFEIIAHQHLQCRDCVTDYTLECTHIQCSDCVVTKTNECNEVECFRNINIRSECDHLQCVECNAKIAGTKTVQCANCITDTKNECDISQCSQCITDTSGQCDSVECRGNKQCSQCINDLAECVSIPNEQCTQCAQCFDPKPVECNALFTTSFVECYKWGVATVDSECVQCTSQTQCRQCSTYAAADCATPDCSCSCHNSDGDGGGE